ncbi:MAG: ammonium transporter [Planctomycetota bacterium]|nr:MAG: ammonium transporter [Planctomycetota bacterium]REK29381.1 MAG: ammonium transporter [Planctomycetota bacterium]REK46788.1 MAG: ammonium transporter [Planctomycetota bacterium]
MDNPVDALVILFTEFYYWVTVVIMFLIHVGFCLYEVGVSREKNKLNTLMKNAMLIPVITVAFFFVGWWIYFAFQNGPGITGGMKEAPHATPWSELMGTHLGGPGDVAGLSEDEIAAAGETNATWARVNGVFWAAFLLFSWTTGSVLSGAVIERIRSGAFWLLAMLVGGVTWILDAAWGWSNEGWMVQLLGFHDAYASCVVHALAGGSALAILIHLGPRIGRFRADGTPRVIPAHNTWMVIIGLFIIYTGFWGFYAACNIPILEFNSGEVATFTATTIYETPTTLSAITFNFIMALTGGMLCAYMISHGDPFWTFSGGLGGIITASAGNDLYHPYQAFFVAVVGVWCAYRLHYWVERTFKIDDAVGAVAVHGYCGSIGVIVAGFLLWGFPSSPKEGFDAVITPWGQFAGFLIMFVGLGFLPCFVFAGLLKMLGVLRIPPEVELAGLDHDLVVDEVAQRLEHAAAERDEVRQLTGA